METEQSSTQFIDLLQFKEGILFASRGLRQAIVASYDPGQRRFNVNTFLSSDEEAQSPPTPTNHAMPSSGQALAYLEDAGNARFDPSQLINALPAVSKDSFARKLLGGFDETGTYRFKQEWAAFLTLIGKDPRTTESVTQEEIDFFWQRYGGSAANLASLINHLQTISFRGNRFRKQAILSLARLVHGRLRVTTLIGFSRLGQTIHEPKKRRGGIVSDFVSRPFPLTETELKDMIAARNQLGIQPIQPQAQRETPAKPAKGAEASPVKEKSIRQIAGATDMGKQRELNEDYLYISPDKKFPKYDKFAVADGMGGEAYGEVASKIACQALVKYKGTLATRIQKANGEIYRQLVGTGGTTVTAARIEGKQLYLAHVGDSRAYLIRGGRIHQLTTDHRWVQEQMDQGFLTKEQAEVHSYKNVLTRAVGRKQSVEVDEYSCELQKGDYVLLCTDGLTSVVNDNVINSIVSRAYSLKEAVQSLIDLANRRGGPDNITVVIRKI